MMEGACLSASFSVAKEQKVLQFSSKFVNLKRKQMVLHIYIMQTVKCFYSNLKFEIEMLFVSKSWGWNKKKLDVNKIDGYAPYTPFPFFKEKYLAPTYWQDFHNIYY